MADSKLSSDEAPTVSTRVVVVSLEIHGGAGHGILVWYQQLSYECMDVMHTDMEDVHNCVSSLSFVNISLFLASALINLADDDYCGRVFLSRKPSGLSESQNATVATCLNAYKKPEIIAHLTNGATVSEPQPSTSKDADENEANQHELATPPRPYLACCSIDEEINCGVCQNQSCSFLRLTQFPIWIDLSDSFKALVERVQLALAAGHSPTLAPEGSGGVYFMKDACGILNAAVFKPMDEEPMAVNNPRQLQSSYGGGEGMKKGTRSGEGAIREVAAYILDHPASLQRRKLGGRREEEEEGFAGVPPCAMVNCYHEAFTYSCGHRRAKLGSLQQFIASIGSCEEMGASCFPVEEVHKITVLDLRLANTDRHSGNILVCRDKDWVLKLVPIDHGYCLPEMFGECTFEWLYWPQASQPYGPSALKYIEALDAEKDIELLQQCGWKLDPGSARVLHVATMLLKKGAAAGLTPFEIGSIMSSCCSGSMASKPPVQDLVEHAEALCGSASMKQDFMTAFESLLDEYIARVLIERSTG